MVFRPKMQFDDNRTDVKTDESREKSENLSGCEETVECENVSEMDYSESPRSSVSTEFAEFSNPSQSNEDSEDNDDSTSTEELVVNLPAGVCVIIFIIQYFF